MRLLRVILLYCLFTYSGSCIADKYISQTAKQRIEQASFIGVISIEKGIKEQESKYKYQVKVKDLIKGDQNIRELKKATIVSNCALSFAKTYLIYAYSREVTPFLISNCVNDLVLEIGKEPPDAKLVVLLPEYMKDAIPLKELNYDIGCYASISGKCYEQSNNILLEYEELRQAIVNNL